MQSARRPTDQLDRKVRDRGAGTNPKQLRILRFIHKTRQVAFSLPGHFRELARVRSPAELYSWTYYKFPNVFPLSRFPTYLTVEPTNECNLSCKHCWRAAMRRPVGSMELALFEKIVAEVSHHRVTEFKLGGSGEPTVHPHFPELMSTLAGTGLRVVLYTNGALFQSFPHREILSWCLDTIVVSVDGLDAVGYEKIKIGSNYNSLRDSIIAFCNTREASRHKRPAVEIRHIIMPSETQLQLLEFRKYWLRTVDSVMFNYLEPATGLLPVVDPHPPKCRQIRRELAIQWDGRVPLCGGYRREYIGSVCDSSIHDLWRNHRLEFLRQCNERRDFTQVPLCMRCCHCR